MGKNCGKKRPRSDIIVVSWTVEAQGWRSCSSEESPVVQGIDYWQRLGNNTKWKLHGASSRLVVDSHAREGACQKRKAKAPERKATPRLRRVAMAWPREVLGHMRGFGAHAFERDFSMTLEGLFRDSPGTSREALYRDSRKDPLGTLYRDFSGDSLGPSRGSLRDTRTLYRTRSGPSRDSPGTSL